MLLGAVVACGCDDWAFQRVGRHVVTFCLARATAGRCWGYRRGTVAVFGRFELSFGAPRFAFPAMRALFCLNFSRLLLRVQHKTCALQQRARTFSAPPPPLLFPLAQRAQRNFPAHAGWRAARCAPNAFLAQRRAARACRTACACLHAFAAAAPAAP